MISYFKFLKKNTCAKSNTVCLRQLNKVYINPKRIKSDCLLWLFVTQLNSLSMKGLFKKPFFFSFGNLCLQVDQVIISSLVFKETNQAASWNLVLSVFYLCNILITTLKDSRSFSPEKRTPEASALTHLWTEGKKKTVFPHCFILFIIFNKRDDSVFGKCKSFALSHFGDVAGGQGRSGDLQSIPLC